MHSGEAVPRVSRETKMSDVIFEMTRKGMGITTVVDGNKLAGVISDGDLRRLLQRGKDIMSLTAGECMTANPKTIDGQEFAAGALNIMEEKKITSLIVTNESGEVEGIIHLHDLWGMQMV
jgi:arabinose-5-phosphate isomerase